MKTVQNKRVLLHQNHMYVSFLKVSATFPEAQLGDVGIKALSYVIYHDKIGLIGYPNQIADLHVPERI